VQWRKGSQHCFDVLCELIENACACDNFKRRRNKPRSIAEVSESGNISLKLFVKWLNNFISYVKPTTENKVLLVLDGHYKFKEFGGYRDNL
jgi:hypothetical protein